MEYNFSEIENKWQGYWAQRKTFAAANNSVKPKYYVLDMFPYPSGAGLHVGHPLGYIASDIVSRYKRLQGFNVLHPMGYDAFGLPAEQYAIQTGQHPEVTTEQNIARYREQLDKIGFAYDWDRQVQTSKPEYYKWTQWIFMQLFKCYYNNKTNKAEYIDGLVAEFAANGTANVNAACGEVLTFTAAEWNAKSAKEQQEILMNYRLAYQSFTMVNWCEALGTVLANDEVVNGVSERGGYPVERKPMRQWSLRITAYAERLLEGLERIDWSDALKEQQRNWIGRSEGAMVTFKLKDNEGAIEVFTTRPDTIFGVSFMVIAPEHELVAKITTPEQKEAVEAYVNIAKNRSERERMTEVKRVSGEFTGAYVEHPFTGAPIPVWIGDYVLAGYGTGAVMAVPAGDERDYAFAKHFNLPIPAINEGIDISEAANATKDAKMVNSGFLDGLTGHEAIKKAIEAIEEKGIGKGKVNFRLRDAGYSRQRYWGEPFPVAYDAAGTPHLLDENDLPVELPKVDSYKPSGSGESPLANAKDWVNNIEGFTRETDTMPGYAGSSWYFLRYMDPKNDKEFVSKDAVEYWRSVDLYLGGSEHAVGHLLYSRMWNKFLFDLGLVVEDEPFKKLINQGMIQGVSAYVYYNTDTKTFASATIAEKEKDKYVQIISPIEFYDRTASPNLDINKFKEFYPDYANATFISDEDGGFKAVWAVEKMSKSKYNVVNPDDIINEYGADTLRMYEMFLGPLEQSKPWNTNGISGVHNFLRRYWRLTHNDAGFNLSEEPATKEELKALHKTIKKVQDDIERFSFNTAVSSFMICVNELSDLKCNKRAIIEPLTALLSPFAPHICEEVWSKLGHAESVIEAAFPQYNAEYTVDDAFAYPIQFNGKMKFNVEVPLNISKEEIEKLVLADEKVQKQLAGSAPKKVIVVPGKIVNIVA
jgi:leucyl-tRNA synthetase